MLIIIIKFHAKIDCEEKHTNIIIFTLHETNSNNMYSDFYGVLPAMCLWYLVQKSLGYVFPKYDKRFHGTIMSMIHASYFASTAGYMLITDRTTNEVMIPLNNISAAYFIYDLRNCDAVFKLHHIASTILLISTNLMRNNEYNVYANQLALIAEITGPLQNFYFIMKSAYGEKNKDLFDKKYYPLFVFYFLSFFCCRMLIAPIYIYKFLSMIKHNNYFMVVLVNSLGLIMGSMYWLKGQYMMIQRLRSKKNK